LIGVDYLFGFNRELISRVFRISLPMLISEIASSIYSVTDMYFVKGLGEDALGAVGIGSYFFWLFTVILSMFNGGLMVYIAQAYGARELDKARRGLGETLVYGAIASILIGVIGYIIGYQVLVLIRGQEDLTATLAYKYFRIRSLGLPLTLISWSLSTSLVAIGETRKSMYANITGIAFNIVLDPLLIYGYDYFPALGVEGAALATILSNVITLLIAYYYLTLHDLKPCLCFNILILKNILSLGIPIAVERAIFSLGNNLYMGVISRCGKAAINAHTIGVRVESFIYMPGFAFSIAGSALVGQSIGAEKIDNAKAIGLEAIKAALVFMTIIGLVTALSSYYITAPFIPEGELSEEIHALASIYLILAGLSEPGLALAMASAGAIRGAGNTRLPVIVNAFSLYLLRILPSIILVQYIGVIGAWIAMFIDVYVRGIILFTIYIKRFHRIARKVV